MRKVRVILYCFLVVALLVLGGTGYWFYSTQSLKNEITATLNKFASFEYSDYQLRGLFRCKSEVVFVKPVLKINTAPRSLFIRFDQLALRRTFGSNVMEIHNPTAGMIVSAASNNFHCKNLGEANISRTPSEKKEITFSLARKGVECYLQDKNVTGNTINFDLAVGVVHLERDSVEKSTQLMLKASENERIIETELTFISNSGTPPRYSLEIANLKVSTPEHVSKIAGTLHLSPSYTSIAKGKLDFTTNNASSLFSKMESKLDDSTKQKLRKFLVNLNSFIDPKSDNLNISLTDKDDALIVKNEKTEKSLLEMF